MQVILVRHTSVDVPRGTCYGQTDVPLAKTFPTEAAATRSQLDKYEPFDAVFSSPLSRATRLASFCGYPHPTLDNRLLEMDMGQWEMQCYDEICDPRLAEWYADYMNLPTTGGEGFPDLYRRVADFLDELRRQDYRRVAIFAHAGVLICAGIYAGIFTKAHAYDHQTPYGGILPIEI